MERLLGHKRVLKIGIVIGLVFFLAGCSGLSKREQRMLSGGAIGSAAGVGVAAVAGGSLLVGGAAGAAAGAIGGLVVEELDKR